MNSFDALLAQSSSSYLETTVKYLEGVDRYQGSATTLQVCQVVAAVMTDYGLSGAVQVLEFQAGGSNKYLGFSGPAEWDLVRGEFEVICDSIEVKLSHFVNPLLVATNSGAFSGSAKIVEFEEGLDVRGCVVLYVGEKSNFYNVLESAKKSGALGVISNSYCKSIFGKQARGRIEIAEGTSVFALSLTDAEVALLRDCLSQQTLYARIVIETQKYGSLPILEYVSRPESSSNEIWLTAHICHPRPGANDNASGVAVAIEIARLLSDLNQAGKDVPPIRVILAPEYIGMACYLSNCKVRPSFVINIDTVGGKADITGAPLELDVDLLRWTRHHQ